MSNFKQDILEVADGESIEAIVIGNSETTCSSACQAGGKPAYQEIVGTLLSWEDATHYLDYEYNPDGAPDCQAIIAWTPNKVIFVLWRFGYDGDTVVEYIPRNPIEHIPKILS